EQRARQGMRRHAHRQALEPGAREQSHRAIRAPLQDEAQRPRPETGGKTLGALIEVDEAARLRDVDDMDDERVELRPLLRRENPGDGLVVGGVGAEAIDGLGRERDKLARAQQLGRAVEIGGGETLGHRSLTRRGHGLRDIVAAGRWRKPLLYRGFTERQWAWRASSSPSRSKKAERARRRSRRTSR